MHASMFWNCRSAGENHPGDELERREIVREDAGLLRVTGALLLSYGTELAGETDTIQN